MGRKTKFIPGQQPATMDQAAEYHTKITAKDFVPASVGLSPENAISAQVAVVDAAKPEADGEADAAPIVQVSRSPAKLDSSRLPAQVRLYARWITQRGEVSDWTLPLPVTVL